MSWEDYFPALAAPRPAARKNPWEVAIGENPWSNLGTSKGYDEEDISDPYKNIRFRPQNPPPDEPTYSPSSFQSAFERPPSNRGMSQFSETQFDSPAMTSYLEHAANVPKREDYSPSVWHRIIAGLAGGVEGGTRGAAAGIKTAMELNEEPYRRALQDYEIKGKGLEAGAKLEQGKQKQRLDYMKAVNDAENDRITSAIRDNDSRTRAKRAEIDAKRYDWKNQLDQAKNQIEADRIKAQQARWEAQSANELSGLENERVQLGIAQQNATTNATRAGYYGQYVQSQAGRPPFTQQTVEAGRGVIISELQNQRPELFGRNGMPVNDAAGQEVEQEIQSRLQRRIRGYGDIPLPAEQGGGGPVVMPPSQVVPDERNPYMQAQPVAPVAPVAPTPEPVNPNRGRRWNRVQ